MLYADVSLARQLELAEAYGNRAFVAMRAQVAPERGATWLAVRGAYAMYDGPESPRTQTFGLGLFEEVTASHLQELEAFFLARNAPVLHEISPLAAPSLMPLLSERGYQPLEYSNVLFQSLAANFYSEEQNNSIAHIRIIHSGTGGRIMGTHSGERLECRSTGVSRFYIRFWPGQRP